MAEIKRRYRGERYRRSRREEIIKKAVKVFAKKGYEATSMDDIAERAKVAKGTLYYYFPGKEDLYHQVMVASIQAIFEDLSETVRDVTCPFEAFTRLLKAAVKLFRGRPDLLTLFLPLMAGQEIPGQKNADDLMGDLMRVHRDLFERHFGALMAGHGMERAHVLRFVARGIIANLLIQLKKGHDEHVDVVVASISDVLRDGLGRAPVCEEAARAAGSAVAHPGAHPGGHPGGHPRGHPGGVPKG